MTMVKAHVFTHELVAGRYRLLDVVSRETNRVCWYGEDVEAQRPCLLTQIGFPGGAGDVGDVGAAGEEDARRTTGRILRMSETLGRVCPGRVVPVVDAVEEAGALWTVTEWVDGTPLGELLAQQGTFNYVRAARIGLELLDVLEAAHGEGITHGELSPGQVYVRDRGPVMVTGFGLAGATLAPRVTAPSYASPEQARDERIGPAADLWALGAILYTMVEGRPPFRERDRPEATLKGVDRLPLRTPLRAGPLAQAVQGLLRKDSRERLTRPLVREALTRVLTVDPDTVLPTAPTPRLRRAYATVRHVGPGWSGRTMAAGTGLAVVTVAVAVLAATGRLPGTGSSAAGARPHPAASASATAPDGAGGERASGTPPPTPTSTPTPTPSSSASATALPSGYHVYDAPEGFSVALPDGWERLHTSRASDLAYRVTFGAQGDPRTLAVTYSERVGPDPVAVWRDDVEPGLEQDAGFQRIGEIRATTYQGYKAADMEWLVDVDGTRMRTFGRGFLLGGHRGFSLRWTTPAADWDKAANEQALDIFLRTFRPGSD
ncbi:serine/threonine-protein kinase [Streptomyces sp. NPDC002928]|uniref:serine/threonine protein kinase n=1 Tax=Streptomyces sp. NPDC002928 TaxID=3154440 RepID=UPI0033A5FBC6